MAFWEEFSNIKFAHHNYMKGRESVTGVIKGVTSEGLVALLIIIFCWRYHLLGGNTHGISQMEQQKLD